MSKFYLVSEVEYELEQLRKRIDRYIAPVNDNDIDEAFDDAFKLLEKFDAKEIAEEVKESKE